MRRIACWGMLIAALAAYRIGYADPPEPAAGDDQPPEARPKQWQPLMSPPRRRNVKRAGKAPTAEELKIEQSLSDDVSVNFEDAPLSDVVKCIGNLAEINIFLDIAGLEDEGVTANTTVSLNVEGIRLKSALNLLLEPLRLGYTVKDDVLKITSRMKQQGELVTVNYPVADLVLPGRSALPGDAGGKPDVQADFSSLMNRISTTIQPDSWEERTGPGSMMPYRTTLSLVIRQTEAVHDEIADLLGQLRGSGELAVRLEMVLLTAPADKLPKFAKAEAVNREAPPITKKAAGDEGFVFRDANARLLLNYAKHRPATTVSPVLGLVVSNGKTSELNVQISDVIDSAHATYGFKVNTVIASDRQSLRLNIVSSAGNADHVLESAISFSVRHGETVACDVTELLEVYRQSNAGADAAASKSPGVREFLIITPRVLAPVKKQELPQP
jgi:hypothetical protein